MIAPLQRIFHLPYGPSTLVGDVISHQESAQLLVLHGAGGSRRAVFDVLRTHFWEHGISSAAFDFVGHGDTGGALRSSSLASRTEQACRVIERLHLPQPFSIMAASMGAYTAVKLRESYAIAHLLLLVPAIYTAQAYEVPFDQGFTDRIRVPHSWEHSDAWALLADYTGQLLIVAAEHDAVIPPGVIQHIYDAAVQTQSRALCVAPDASHFVITDVRTKHPAYLASLLGCMTDMLATEQR